MLEEMECGVEVYHSVARWVERAHADGGMTRQMGQKDLARRDLLELREWKR